MHTGFSLRYDGRVNNQGESGDVNRPPRTCHSSRKTSIFCCDVNHGKTPGFGSGGRPGNRHERLWVPDALSFPAEQKD